MYSYCVTGRSCECQPGYKYTKKFGGDQVACEACASNEVLYVTVKITAQICLLIVIQ